MFKDNGKKIALNTVVIYAKMFIQIVVSLYTVRILLESLGVDYFGVFTLSAGIMALFSFLNSAMSVSTQRYLSYYQGADEPKIQAKIFSSSIVLHFAISVITILFLLVIMPFLFDQWLNIDDAYILNAKYLYLCMLVSLFFTIMSVPFVGVLYSRENVLIDSALIILQTVLKLLAAFYLTQYPYTERLSVYGQALTLISLVVFLSYCVYCMTRYDECKLKMDSFEFSKLKEMTLFAVWNLYSNLCYVLNNQGLNIIINIFLGTAANAAYGVSSQVNGQVRELSLSLVRVLNPQIMKSEGMNNRQRMLNISMLATKLGFFLVSIVTIPALFSMPKILDIWLTNVPVLTSNICIFLLISTMINQTTVGINSAMLAIGNIKRFQMYIGTIALLTLPLSYLMLEMYTSIYPLLGVLIIIELVTGGVKVGFFCSASKIGIRSYLENCILRLCTPLILLFSLQWVFYTYFNEVLTNLQYLLISVFLMLLLYTPSYYIFALSHHERIIFNDILKAIIKRLPKRVQNA
ncbi:MATE family efflux transporter [Vibrio diabolicus]|uniref:MATE family efflux transporter n=1 Tax=Vibrio diabolicus TaxID=50719 RepID=UPI003753CC2A